MTTTAKPKTDVSATTVSRFLKAAGMRRGETHASGVVRGWHNRTSGFTVEQGKRYEPNLGRPGVHSVTLNWAVVEWQHNTDDLRGSKSQEARTETEARQMAKAADILRGKGYAVEVSADGTRLTVKPGA